MTTDEWKLPFHSFDEDLQWTTTPPTEEGWYWVRNVKGKIWCEEVFKKDGVMCWWSEDENTFNSIILDYITHWLGPLPIPEPPQ
jgi:hypothetical protein